MTDGPRDGEEASFLQRLRRRKVVQWGIAYAAGAWGLQQGIAYVSGLLHWPDQLQKLTGLALLLGWPVAITLAWYHGDKGQQRVSRTEFAVLTLLLLLGGGLFSYYQRSAPMIDAATSTQAATPAATISAPDDRSIAVLPFVNMSADREQDYFADGISEELLNLLAQIPDLRVIARTSSFSFKHKEADIATIAKALNVANILEGSVRKSGDSLRITAQLIRASDSSHVWSQTYDRQLTDVFAIQDEIAAAVVGQLKLTLLGAAPKAKEADPEAYELLLQARALFRQGTPEDYEHAIALAQQALARDPTLTAAWDLLSSAYSNQAGQGLRPISDGYALAREAADKALALDPGYASAYSRLGWIEMSYDRDLAQAARYLQQALALAPGDTGVLRNAAALAGNLGRLEQAIAIEEYVVARDPVNPVNHVNLGYHYRLARRFDAAITSLRRGLLLAPGYIGAQSELGLALLSQGHGEAALAETLKEPSEARRLLALATVYHALGRQAYSDAALAELIARFADGWAYNIAYVLADRGEFDGAFEWLDKAVANKDGGLAFIVTEPLFANLRSDPRWSPFLQKIGKAPEQLAAIPFEVTLPR